jgi:hypothetical protein
MTVVTRSLTNLAATAAIAVALMTVANSADAQVVMVATPGSLGIYAPPPVASVVCEVRRQQFSDEYGWRVRDVVVCFAR